MVEERRRPLDQASFFDLDFHDPQLGVIFLDPFAPLPGVPLVPIVTVLVVHQHELLGRLRLSREGQYAPDFGDGGLIGSDLRFFDVRVPKMNCEKAADRAPDPLRGRIELDRNLRTPCEFSDSISFSWPLLPIGFQLSFRSRGNVGCRNEVIASHIRSSTGSHRSNVPTDPEGRPIVASAIGSLGISDELE